MSFRVVDGRIQAMKDGIYTTLRAPEIWERRVNDFLLPDGIEILGYGHIFIDFTDSEITKIAVGVSVEGREFFLESNMFPLTEYIVVNEALWIPLYEKEIHIINNLVTNNQILSSSKLHAKTYVNLLKIKHSNELEVRLPTDTTNLLKVSESVPQIPSLNVEPFKYQRKGIEWLISLFSQSVGGILADQMGLGKTIQLIALAIYSVNNSPVGEGRTLIVVPNSLKENWKSEFLKFAPESHQPYVHAGQDRDRATSILSSKSIILTTYDTLNRDVDLFRELKWGLILCDEAQCLKNYRTQRRISIASLEAGCRFLATGTPVENELLDLWSLMDIVHPGIMGEAKTFQSVFENNAPTAESIGNAVKPLILRRKTRDVLSELPTDIRTDEIIEATEEFAELYEDIKKSAGQRPSMQIIQTLRLFCCYPPLVIKSLGSISDAKAERLLDILDNIAAQVDEKAIIFTGFHDSADYLNKFISRQFPGVFVAVYDGRIKDTADRELIRKKFSDFPGFAVLIANPRTAGEGLNIVSANHVIHFNLDWNPQKENQASARVLRPGQERTVFIHRMFYKGTVEEYIHARAEHKSQIAQAALSAAEHEADSKSIEQALSMTPLFGYYSRNSISIPKSPSSIDWSAFSREDR